MEKPSGWVSVDALARARAAVFDFDGTLVDSNPIKARAFERCFSGLTARRDEVLAYCCANHHVPRGEKFRHVYERILEQPYTPEIARRLHEQFEAETAGPVIQAPTVPGALEFLAAIGRSRVTGVLSSTPHEVLVRILEGRGWQGYFRHVQGAPVNKARWLAQFQAQEGLAGDELAFFGDTDEDEAAARAAGCGFIRVGRPSTGGQAWCVPDFRPLVEQL